MNDDSGSYDAIDAKPTFECAFCRRTCPLDDGTPSFFEGTGPDAKEVQKPVCHACCRQCNMTFDAVTGTWELNSATN